MNEETKKKQTHTTWYERLIHLVMREPQDREELLKLLRDAEQRQLFDADALSMIEGVLQVSELQAREIMIPRGQMACISDNQSVEEFLPMAIETAHSRFPVLDSDEKVIGIIHAKDLLRYSMDQYENFDLRNIIRPPNFVPESRRLDKLLKDFRLTHNHMAIVVDEYGEIAGLVTIEDIIEQIVGEIEDEFDIADDAMIKKHSDDDFIVKAVTPIDEFNDYFQSDFSDKEFDTVGGLVTNTFGRVPKRGEVVRIENFQFRVLNSDKRHIRLLQATLI